MKTILWATGVMLLYVVFALSSCAMQEERVSPAAPAPAPVAEAPKAPPPEKAPEKAKALKAKGDVGLLHLEKNYMILVTKEGKLITIDFDTKAKATKVEPTPSKMEEIGLGSSAVVEYVTKEEKNVITSIEYKAAKGGD